MKRRDSLLRLKRFRVDELKRRSEARVQSNPEFGYVMEDMERLRGMQQTQEKDALAIDHRQLEALSVEPLLQPGLLGGALDLGAHNIEPWANGALVVSCGAWTVIASARAGSVIASFEQTQATDVAAAAAE